MKERFWITVFIRVAGLLGMLRVVHHWARLYHVQNGNVHFDRAHFWTLIFEICLMLVGVYMVRGAPLFVRLIAPKDKDEKPDSN